MKQYLEAGVVATTHGVRGEIKVNPWSDSPEFLKRFSRVFIDGRAYKLLSARAHKSQTLIQLEGVCDVDQAMRLRGKIVSICRDDIALEEGTYFVQDIIGLQVYDLRTQTVIGAVRDVLTLPAGDVYVIGDDKRESMIPVNPVFIKQTDLEKGIITVETIKGMLENE